ncbi:hypothetical protein ACKS23_07405 [Histoplasma ohiense]
MMTRFELTTNDKQPSLVEPASKLAGVVVSSKWRRSTIEASAIIRRWMWWSSASLAHGDYSLLGRGFSSFFLRFCMKWLFFFFFFGL